MAQKRRRFTTGFKKWVALRALHEQDMVQRSAERHGVHQNQVSTWKRKAVEGLPWGGRGRRGAGRGA